MAPGSINDLEQVVNFRDVGRTINEYTGERRLREAVFFRSARLDEGTARDRHILTQDVGLKTVIDLRTKTEHLKQAEKHAKKQRAVARSNAAAAEPLQIPGLDYHAIKITGRPFERFLVRQLSWWSFIKFIFLFAFGYRLEAISILTREVIIPRGLLGLATNTLDMSPREINETLCLYTNPAFLPSVVHCTQGKDRTGLICALVLMILGVPIDAIEHDYFLSDNALVQDREARMAEIRSIGLTEEWAFTSKTLIPGLANHLEEKYGGLDAYLDGIGFDKGQRYKVEEALLY